MEKQYFSIPELTKSATAKRCNIDNKPDAIIEGNLQYLINHLLQPIRVKFGEPIIVDSGYRCKALNDLVGGVKTSQHMQGQAVDIRTADDLPVNNKRLFDCILHSGLDFDQLIDEYGYNWVHVSLKRSNNRRQILHLT